MNTQYRLLAIDIDGTLLNDEKQLTPATLEALLKVQEHGVTLALASGRPTYGMQGLAEALKLKEHGGYILSYNGGKITASADGAILLRNTIPLSLIPEIYNAITQEGLPMLVYRRHTILTEDAQHEAVLIDSKINNDMEITEVPSLVEAVITPPFKCTAIGKPDEIARLKHHFEVHYPATLSVHLPVPEVLDVTPVQVDKAHALEFLLRELDLDKKQLIAVGDSYNDIKMIGLAGLGVAMANATEAVKQCAEYVTKSNNEDGIAHLVYKHILQQERAIDFDLDQINELSKNTLLHALGIRITHVSIGRVEATMPVDIRTRQPMGILHGGASLALAETVAGLGSIALLDENEVQAGMQVSGNHISSAHEGEVVKAVGTILHKGRSSHVWNVDISTQSGKLVSTIRVINSIMRKR